MKITRDEFKRSDEKQALELFWQGIRAVETREKYTRTLKRILCVILEDFLSGTFEQRADQLVKLAKEDQSWITDLLLNLSRKLKERTNYPKDHPDYLNPSSIDNYFKPVRKLLDMNDVTLSWKRIYTTFPEIDNLTQTREWKREEIQDMLKFANGAMDRSIILIAASSGIRAGAFRLKWEDIVPIYKVDDQLRIEVTDEKQIVACAMIIVYKGTSSQYPAFITQEAHEALQDYKKEWANQIGREPKPDDPIFIQEGSLLRMASVASIKKRVIQMAEKAGLRKPLTGGKKRYDVPIMNGFRRFFNKTIKQEVSGDSALASLIKKEYMLGHSGLVKLDRNYFKTNVIELAEEYLDASYFLTISDESRLQIENTHLKEERHSLVNTNLIKSMQKRIDDLESGKTARKAHYNELLLDSKGEYEKEFYMYLANYFENSLSEKEKRDYFRKMQSGNAEPIPPSQYPSPFSREENYKFAKKLLEESEIKKDSKRSKYKAPKINTKALISNLRYS